MKKIWKFDRTGGTELEVSDDFPISVPFTDVEPLDGYELYQQYFDTSEQKWKALQSVLDKEELEYLRMKTKTQETQLNDVQNALVEIYESLLSI